MISQSNCALCDMFCPTKHHMTKTTQESKGPDKHTPGAHVYVMQHLQLLYVFTLFYISMYLLLLLLK